MRCGAWGWNVFEPFDAASFLDIVREIPSCAIFHYQVDVGVRSLEGMLESVNSYPVFDCTITYHYVEKPRNMSVRERFENLDFAL